MEFVTLDTLKNILAIADDTHNSTLEKIIDDTNTLISEKVGDISYREHTERVDGNGNSKIYLKRISDKIISVTADNQDVEVDFIDGYIIYLKKNFPKKKKSIVVRYMAGYKNPPAELTEIAKNISREIVAENFSDIVKKDSALPNTIKQKQLGDLSITYFSNSEMRKNSKNALVGLDGNGEQLEKIFAKYRTFS